MLFHASFWQLDFPLLLGYAGKPGWSRLPGMVYISMPTKLDPGAINS